MVEAIISLSKTKGLSVWALRNIRIQKLNIASALIAVVLTVCYLFITNNVSTANYRKIMLEKNIDNLRTEIRALNLELTQKRSVGFIKTAAENLNLVVNDAIQYIKTAGPVAKNQ